MSVFPLPPVQTTVVRERRRVIRDAAIDLRRREMRVERVDARIHAAMAFHRARGRTRQSNVGTSIVSPARGQ